MEHGEAFRILDERNWSAECSRFGIWAVGPEDESGVLSVLGLATSLEEAVAMAVRSANAKEISKTA
jgi:hypothetical protein